MTWWKYLLVAGRRTLANVNSSEASYFKPVAAVVPLTTNEFDFALTIEAPVFKEGNKWRFSDGSSTFYADIEDKAFLKRVDEGAPFAKGDALRLRLRVEQTRQGAELATTRTVTHVAEHIRRQETRNLF